MKTFVQLGACAGDQDPRVNNRDGFTEYVKAKDRTEVGLIVLVEANPLNIPALTECWKSYDQARIYNAAVRTSDMSPGAYEFFYALEDAPHYQVASFEKSHVMKHYPDGTIQVGLVPTLDVNSILKGVGPEIEMLGIDVETMDAKILFDIRWEEYNIRNFSFEFTNMDFVSTLKPLMQFLESKGYSFIGKGLDHNGEDFMYTKAN